MRDPGARDSNSTIYSRVYFFIFFFLLLQAHKTPQDMRICHINSAIKTLFNFPHEAAFSVFRD